MLIHVVQILFWTLFGFYKKKNQPWVYGLSYEYTPISRNKCVQLHIYELIFLFKRQKPDELWILRGTSLRSQAEDVPIKHFEEVLITLWLFRSWTCQIHPQAISQWWNQYSSYFIFILYVEWLRPSGIQIPKQ